MKISVYIRPEVTNLVSIQARAEGPGKTLGDMRTEVRPGQNFLGWTYEELMAMGTGNYDLQPKPGWTPPRQLATTAS